ncbi:hypothetical protein C0431_12625 [bacterium]|nr:hypothetical protein [bacterium]
MQTGYIPCSIKRWIQINKEDKHMPQYMVLFDVKETLPESSFLSHLGKLSEKGAVSKTITRLDIGKYILPLPHQSLVEENLFIEVGNYEATLIRAGIHDDKDLVSLKRHPERGLTCNVNNKNIIESNI